MNFNFWIFIIFMWKCTEYLFVGMSHCSQEYCGDVICCLIPLFKLWRIQILSIFSESVPFFSLNICPCHPNIIGAVSGQSNRDTSTVGCCHTSCQMLYLSISRLCLQMLLWHPVHLGLLIKMMCYIINAALLINTHLVPHVWRRENWC